MRSWRCRLGCYTWLTGRNLGVKLEDVVNGHEAHGHAAGEMGRCVLSLESLALQGLASVGTFAGVGDLEMSAILDAMPLGE